MDLLSYSDIGAAASGALFAEVFSNIGSTQEVAIRSLAVSIVARILSKNVTIAETIPVNEASKNQAFVSILNFVYAYFRKQNMTRIALSGMSIDLLGTEILRSLKLEDTVLFSTVANVVKP